MDFSCNYRFYWFIISYNTVAFDFWNKKDGHSHSGVPFIGGIHFLIAGLISPCKWLALLCLLDYAFIGSIYKHINPDAYNVDDNGDADRKQENPQE